MTRAVRRDEIIDYATYEEVRDAFRTEVMSEKAVRRVHLGGVLTFLFETTRTVRYQIQEMVRAERMVREADIAHEIETYNDLLGGPGEVGLTLLIELDDPEERARKLVEWVDLPKHIYARVGGQKIYARYDERQVGDDRVSSVQYLKLPVGGKVPSAIGCDHPGLNVETPLPEPTLRALAQDLT